MKVFKWKCPTCETINSDVACAKCGHIPEFYIPLPSVELKPERIKPVPDESPLPVTGWVCPNCGAENEASRKKCSDCKQPKTRKPKTKSVGSVRPGVFVSVFLICTFIITAVVIGKLTAVIRPEVFNEGLSAIFNITVEAPDIPITGYTPMTPTTIELNRVYPNPPEDGCVLWSDINVEHTGQTLCVYGLVYSTFIGEPTQFNIIFSEEKDTFRMVMTGVLEEEQPKLLGECVYQTAVIKFYKSLPYISFSQPVSICEK
jgi:hypothetical protein